MTSRFQKLDRGLSMSKPWTLLYLLSALLLGGLPYGAFADGENLLTDRSGDGIVSVLAFGDSLTYGIGDGFAPGADVQEIPRDSQSAAGYPKRVQQLAGLRVINAGVPGEVLSSEGVSRFASIIQNSNADTILILEGSNDANLQVPLSTFRNTLQRAINAAKALGREVVVLTIPPPCCNRASLKPFTDAFTREQERLAYFNGVALADIARAWKTTCDDINQCNLMNVPEGLHPNTLWYDVMSQTVLASLYGIDIFSPGGAADLAGALGVSETDIDVKPDLTNAEPKAGGN